MTFLQLQDDALERLNLPLDVSSTARTRIKRFLNEGYRLVLASPGLSRAKDATTTLTTVAEQAEYTVTCRRIRFMRDTDNDADLEEITLGQIRSWDPGESDMGQPLYWAVRTAGASTVTVRLHPIPSDIRTLDLDIEATATDLTADGDIPVLLAEFHGLLVQYAIAQEFLKMDDTRYSPAMAAYERQLALLRFALRKSDTRLLAQNGHPRHRPSRLGWQFPEFQ